MHQRHSAKSLPPALIDDGRRYFFYDGDDQLTQVVVSNAWMADFQYDGQRRRCITRDYAWQGSTWTKANELRYVYDGMLVIQERDANNLPIKNYIRGLDLSGSLQGAGGIGGLLAMTDHEDITTRHYYYHSDANGNVTALINEQQVVMARYAYDPFGNQISAVGPVSGLNPYRFSSKEWQPNSGLYYYGYRFYEPNLQRWPNQDPIGEDGGILLYCFARNNAINNIDTLGLLSASLLGMVTSREQHGNHIRFLAQCSPCKRVANIQIDYSEVEKCLIGEWIGQQIKNRNGPSWIFTDPDYFKNQIGDGGVLGGLSSPTGITNCKGEPVEIQVFMRTRLVAGGASGHLWRFLHSMPDPSVARRCYNLTRVSFDCEYCTTAY